MFRTVLLSLVSLSAGLVHAQDVAPAPVESTPAPPAPPAPADTAPVSPFANGVRSSWIAPLVTLRLGNYTTLGGDINSQQSTSDYGNGPVIFFLSTGMRVHSLAVSLVFGFGGAGASDATQMIVGSSGATANDNYFTALFGGEVEYRFRHLSKNWTPFVGGMLGYGTTSASGDFSDRDRVSIGGSGLHLRATAGADYALTGWFGIGIVAELALTSYGAPTASFTTEDDPLTFDNETAMREEDIAGVDGGTGAYAGLAARIVFFP